MKENKMKVVTFDLDGMILHGQRFSERYAAEFDINIEDMIPFFGEPFDKCITGQADLKEELIKGGWLEKWKWQGSVEKLLAYWAWAE